MAYNPAPWTQNIIPYSIAFGVGYFVCTWGNVKKMTAHYNQHHPEIPNKGMIAHYHQSQKKVKAQ